MSGNIDHRDQTLRLLLCLLVSIVFHLSFIVSGRFFSKTSETSGVRARAIIEVVLASRESRSEIGQSEQPSEMTIPEATLSVDTKENVSSTADKAAAESEEVEQASKPAGLVDSDRYHVRSELSQAPKVINDVLITAPPTKGDFAWRLRIRLFLSEYGFVDRLIVEDSTAPVYVEEDAIKQFRSARYSPGSIDGRQVNSQLVIDITEP